MTVKELIQSLSKIEDQDIRVMVKGYEGGYNDVDNINTSWFSIVLSCSISCLTVIFYSI